MDILALLADNKQAPRIFIPLQTDHILYAIKKVKISIPT